MLLTFRIATEQHDLPVVLDLLNESAAWLRSRNIIQWPESFGANDDWRITRIHQYIRDARTWIAEVDGQPVATFSLAGPDPDFAHGWPDDSRSLHIYRLAARRDLSGNSIGARILDWASSHAEADGCTWLRFDCHRDNLRLQRYYEHLGFVRVGTVIHPTRMSGALYQRAAGTVQVEGTTGQNTTTTDETGAIRQSVSPHGTDG